VVKIANRHDSFHHAIINIGKLTRANAKPTGMCPPDNVATNWAKPVKPEE